MNNNPLYYFFKYMKYTKFNYFIGFLIMTIITFLSTFSTYIFSKIFNNNYRLAIFFAVIFFIISIFTAILEYINKYFLIKASNDMYVYIQKDVYDHIQSLPIKNFDNMSAGSLVSNLINDVNKIKNFFESTFLQVCVILIKLISIYLILFFVDYKMAIVLITLLIFMILVKFIYEKISFKLSFKNSKLSSKLNAIINESLQNLDIIKSYNKETEVLNEYKNISQNRLKTSLNITKLNAIFLHNLTGLLNNLIYIIIIFYYAYSKFNNLNLITTGMVYLFIRYTLDIINAVTGLIINLSNYAWAVGAAKNLLEILKLEPEKIEKIRVEEVVKKFIPKIKFENVSFYYKDENYILKNINFEIKENQTVAFVGRTGSGKSTILSLIIKFYEAQKGQIYISDENIKNLTREYLRENISIVMQDSFLFEGTLLDNICPHTKDRKLAMKVIKELGIEILFENGRTLDTKISVNGNNFSYGEKQLISFARSLARNPKILILDEATANIDDRTETYIKQSIEKLKENRTTIIIAHRLSTIRQSDVIYVLDKGEIVESGNHNELLRLNKKYAEMIKNQI